MSVATGEIYHGDS